MNVNTNAIATAAGAALLLVACATETPDRDEATCPPQGALDHAAPGDDPVVAQAGDEEIRLSEVGAEVAFRIYRHRVDIYSLLASEAEREVDERLIAAEAERRGLSPKALREEVRATAEPASDEEVDAYIRDHPNADSLGAAARPRIRHYLTERRRNQRELEFTESLREREGYELLIERPRMPRITLDTSGAPSRGPDDAAIEIVHFADFASPRSARSAERLERLRERFPGTIRWFHRHALRPNDERALAAAELATLAEHHGAFWEAHDRLMAKQGRLRQGDLDALAEELGLRAEWRAADADRDELLTELKRDLDEAERAGIEAPPAVFVNGRYFSPTFPYDELEALVEAELGRL